MTTEFRTCPLISAALFNACQFKDNKFGNRLFNTNHRSLMVGLLNDNRTKTSLLPVAVLKGVSV